MRELEKNVLCVLLGALKERELILENVYHQARTGILNGWNGPEFFYSREIAEELDGYTQNSC